jgi:hypothetical protein
MTWWNDDETPGFDGIVYPKEVACPILLTLHHQQWRIKKETRQNKTKQISTRPFHHNSQNGRWLLFAPQGHLTRLHVNKRVDPIVIKKLIFRKQFIWIPESI